jgi:hypothetical protein
MSPTGRSGGGLRQPPGPGGRSKQTTHRQMVRLARIRTAASAEAAGQLAERKVRLLTLGFGRSGKTTFLTCMAQHFKGTPDGIRFVTDRASERKLNQQFEKLRQQGTFPKSTGQTESITFTVRGPVASRPIDVFTLTYMDYDGDLLDKWYAEGIDGDWSKTTRRSIWSSPSTTCCHGTKGSEGLRRLSLSSMSISRSGSSGGSRDRARSA